MQRRTLGSELSVSAMGVGGSVLSPGMYGDVDDAASIRTIHRALDLGINFIDTSNAYGIDGHNEGLVGRAIRGRREEVVVATKFGLLPAEGDPGRQVDVSYDLELTVNARPEYVRGFAEASLARLGIDVIDLYYLHFPDPGTPIEDSVEAMAELVADGKVRYLGLSNVDGDQLRRGHAVHPIAAVQVEYSLWSRQAEADVLPVAQELGVGFVAWNPLGAGFLTASVTRLERTDFRNRVPRFKGENLKQNIARFAPLFDLARELGMSPAQLALAWLLHQGEHIVPIPGTRSTHHMEENVASTGIRVDASSLERIDQIAPSGLAVGETFSSGVGLW